MSFVKQDIESSIIFYASQINLLNKLTQTVDESFRPILHSRITFLEARYAENAEYFNRIIPCEPVLPHLETLKRLSDFTIELDAGTSDDNDFEEDQESDGDNWSDDEDDM